MSYRVLALQSGVTGLEDHRLTLNALAWPNGTGVKVYGGVSPQGFGVTNPSAMTLRVAPGLALIPGTGTSTQGAYLFASDANVDITFDNGEAGVTRTDRVIARIYDNTYDATGQTKGIVEYLKGQASGAATALPANSLLLYEQSVAAGASAGGTPINFSTITDKRQFLTAAGGVQLIRSATDRDALTPSWTGKMIWRTDRGWLEVQDSSNTWRVRSLGTVAGTGNFNQVSSPFAGQILTLSTTGQAYTYNGSAWERLEDSSEVTLSASRSSNQSVGNNSLTTVICNTTNWNKGGITYSTSTGIATVTEDGLYRVTGRIQWDFSNVGYRELYVVKNSTVTCQAGQMAVDSGYAPTQNFSTELELTSGDTVKIQAKQGSGGALNIQNSTFQVRRMGSGI